MCVRFVQLYIYIDFFIYRLERLFVSMAIVTGL